MRPAWALGVALALSPPPAGAVIVTTGAGSAVPVADALATFESHVSLTLNPYLEDGLRFQRVGLTNNNNGCGFAGCGFPYFSGNYFYGATPGTGAGGGGYINIFSDAALFVDSVMYGIEFVAGTGVGEPVHYAWAAFLGGALVGEGTGVTDAGTVLGFHDAGGFTHLHWTTSSTAAVTLDTSFNGPAIDDVRVTYTQPPAPIPAPGMGGLLLVGALGLAAAGRRRSA